MQCIPAEEDHIINVSIDNIAYIIANPIF